MKNINKTIKATLFVAIIILAGIRYTYAQNSSHDKKEAEKKTAIENSVKNKHFKFIAQTVVPQRGGNRTLTTAYDVTVTGDTLQSYLPYFGRAFTAPIYTGKSPLEFTSTNFEYKVTDRKKGGWDVYIKSNDQTGERFLLTVFDNGNATLQVTSNNRSPITFYGYVREK